MANRGINKVILIGNLGQNPEIRHMPNGNAVTNITVATTESWKDKQTGEVKERTEWHKVVIFGRLAEIAAEYLQKGSQIYVEGCLQTRKWQDSNGQDRYSTEIIVNMNGKMQMLGNKQSVTLENYENNSKINNWEQNKNIKSKNNNKSKNETSPRSVKNILPSINDDESIEFDDEIPF